MTKYTKTETEKVTKMTVEMKTKVITIEGEDWKNEEQEVQVRLPNGGLVVIRVSNLCELEDEIDVMIHGGEDMTTTLFHGSRQKVSKKKVSYDNITSWTDITIE